MNVHVACLCVHCKVYSAEHSHVCMHVHYKVYSAKAMTSLQVFKFLGSSYFLEVNAIQLQTHYPILDQTFKVCLTTFQVCLIAFQLFNQIIIMT
jgi:hypothetical protein